MSDVEGFAAPINISQLSDLAAAFSSSDSAVERAKAAIVAASAPPAPEATAEEIEDRLDEIEPASGVMLDDADGGWPLGATIGGAGGAAVLLAGLYALRRRGREQSDEAARAIERQDLSRREMLSAMAVAGVGLGVGGALLDSQLPALAQVESTGLNVLAIVVDDLNDYPTFMGGSTMPVHTPNMDALAGASRTFVNHHVTVPICPPSRATLMYGLDASQHNLTGWSFRNAEYEDFARTSIERSIPVLARQQGITAVGGGKVFHNQQYNGKWDRFLSTKPAEQVVSPFVGFDYGPLIDDRNPDLRLTNAMVESLGGFAPDEQFVMMPGIRLPHLPWRVPQRYLDLYPLNDIVLPDTPEDDWDDLGPVATAQLEQYSALYEMGLFELVEGNAERALLMQGYLASMSHTDDMVGVLLNELASSPFADNTVVMLISDNGYHQGENFAYRKLTLRDQSTKTPFLVRPAGDATFTPGAVDQVVSSNTFMPTLLDVLGVPAPAGLPGVSLRDDRLPAPIATTHAYGSASLVYGDSTTGGRWTMHFGADGVPVDGDYTLDAVTEMELYERAVDPDEFDNLLPQA